MVNSTWIGSPNHYAGRNGYEVTHITLHIMVGRLAGTDATFQNPVRQASSTYGIGSTGLIHQYVRETDAPWTDSNYASNCQTISIEHEDSLMTGKEGLEKAIAFLKEVLIFEGVGEMFWA